MLRQEVIRRIVVREQQKLNLTEKVIRQEEPALHRAARDSFGAWHTALLYAGVNLKKLRQKSLSSRQQVLEHIKRCCWHGCKLTARNAQHFHYRLYQTALKYFDSWETALQAAGINLPLSGLKAGKPRRWSKAEILEEMRQWSAAGHPMGWHDICLQNRELAMAAKTAFQSWRKALIAAGLRSPAAPALPRRKWSRELVLEIIREREQSGKSLERKVLRNEDPSLLYHACKYFDGWKAALAEAGITGGHAPQPHRDQSGASDNAPKNG
jgi:hypothetical protein